MKVGPVLNFLGVLFIFLSVFMALPAVWAFYYREDAWISFILPALGTLIGGFAIKKLTNAEPGIGIREGFAIVVFGWAGVVLLGAVPYLTTGSIPSFTNAVFESVAGFTTTGASILSDVESLPKSVLFWRSFTHWLGGMGIVVLSLAILPFLGTGGMQLYRAEVAGPTKDRLTPRIQRTAKVLWGIYLLITLLGTALLMLCGMDFFDALCHTFGALATGGFSTRNASIGAFDNPWIPWVVILIMLLGATDFALHFYALRGKPLNYFKSSQFRSYFLTLIGAVVLVVVFSYPYLRTTGESVVDCVFEVVSMSTTTGYVTADYEKWHPVVPWIIMGLLFPGGMAGSTAGGMKFVRVMIAAKSLHLTIRRFIHPQGVYAVRVDDRPVAEEIVQQILAFCFLYVIVFFLCALGLAATGVDFITSFGASLACISGTGPGLGLTGAMGNYYSLPIVAKWILIVEMVLGRLEFYAVLIIVSRSFWKK